MLKGATARRYAEALFEIGNEHGTLDRWLDDVRTIGEYFSNRRLLFVLHEPKIPFDRKEAMVRDLLASKVQPDALNFALVLVQRGIAEIAPAVATQFERQYNDFRGQALAQVTTAVPLDAELRAQLTRQLETITGKHILLSEQVQPEILGGAIARVGDTLIDGSLKRRFSLLREQLRGGGVLGTDDGLLASLLPNGGEPDGASPSDAGPGK